MSSRPRILVLAAAATAAATLTLPPTAPVAAAAASEAPVWGPVRTLTANPRGQSLTVDADGTVTVVWATSSTRRIVALQRPAGGAWGDRAVVGRGSDPQVAADGMGNVTLAWVTPGRAVAVARHRAGGDWSAPMRVSTAGEGRTATDLVLAVDPAGDAVVAWSSRDARDLPWRVRAAYRPADGRWSAPEAVTPANGTRSPLVGIAGDGTVVLLVTRQRFGHPQVLRTHERAPDGAWTGPSLVTREGYGPALAVDLAGNAVVAFSPDFESVRASARPAGGAWGHARSLSPAGLEIDDYSLAMTGAGDAVLALGRVSGRVDVLRRPAGGPWSASERVVTRGTTVYDVVVAVDDAGGTFLGWGGYALLGAYQPPGGSWSEGFTISPDAGVEVLESTHARVAPDGDVAVLWEQEARPLKVRIGSVG